MATMGRSISGLLLCLCLILILTEVSGRGGRGGGGRGGSRGGSRGGYRGGTRGTYRSGSSYRGGRFGGFGWKSAAAAGYIYGYTSYSRRRVYHSHPNSEPSICNNLFDYARPNGTYYTYFICPMADQSEDYTYCCGPSNRQKCCRFQDDGGRVAGVVIGCLLGAGLIGLCAYCCCCRKSKEPKEPITVGSTFSKAHSYPVATAGAPPPPGAGAYQSLPTDPGYPDGSQGNPPFTAVPASGPKPSYPQDPGMTYPADPNMVYPPPSGGPAYPPSYGIQPADAAYPPPAAPYPPNDPNFPTGGAPYPTGPVGYPTGDAPPPGQPSAYPPQPVPYNIPPSAAPAYPSAPPPSYSSSIN